MKNKRKWLFTCVFIRIRGEPQCRRNPLGKQEKKRFGAVNSRPDNDKTISNTLIKKELVSDRYHGAIDNDLSAGVFERTE